ncbi:sensor domain-containing diguanylate cyclase [Lacticaseibacillus sharpeae]|uniref:Signal transduction diguanylate cyclase n=3 Tax=Lacticaseibacillus sharpeae TaxID=1626 RepID=A0A0R1ZW33_9LACO|nr:sensor domain-containing diguanylate cyclase [Lacticaseibacillus sharpeae]KRM55251.1 Signal transduction diguanylate cyclase [Lacticaseibacillus sharpeae JCM 1186 = DSM 20505]
MDNISLVKTVQILPTQIAIAAFFAMGFVTTYYWLWRRALVTTPKGSRQYLARVELLLSGLGLTALLFWMGFVAPLSTNAMMFHNLGLYIVFFMLCDARINFGEYLVRAAAVLFVVAMHNFGNFDRWQGFVSLAAVLLIELVVYIFDRQVRNSTWGSTLLVVAMACSVWPFVPAVSASASLTVTPVTRVEAILLFVIMSYIGHRYWARQDRLATVSTEMTVQANYDALTNARSFSLFERDIAEMFTDSQANGTPLTVVMFDIDHFKAFNDHFGHPAGDAVLAGVVATVRKAIGEYLESDYLYRVGGEEFVALFPNMTVTQATRIARAMVHAVRATTFTYEAVELHVTLSMGVTAVRADDEQETDTYKRVDEFLYQSKHAGRDTITIEGHSERSDGQQENTGYRFFSQPIVDVSSDDHQLIARELLLRMRSADGARWLLPNTFDIDVDVQIALIRSVLVDAETQHLGLNLLPSQFVDFRVARALSTFVQSTPNFNLTIELTGVPDAENLTVLMGIYHDAGIRIAIDNVGSVNHYEAMVPLLKYVDVLKFSLQNLRRSHDTVNLDTRINFWKQVADDNGCLLMVTGVETRRDATHLRSRFGITVQEGYLYGKPRLALAK